MRKHVETCNHCSGFISLYTICQDKFLSYLFVEKFGWPIPKQYFNGFAKDFQEDLLNNNNIVIKATHGCSSREVICIKNGVDFFKKEEISGNSLIEKFNKKFIISEELLVDKEYDGLIPLDFKCFVFNGNIELLCICERFPKTSKIKKKEVWYDKNLNHCGKLMKQFPADYIYDKYLPKQKQYCEELDIVPSKCVIFGLDYKEQHTQYKRRDDDKEARLCFSRVWDGRMDD